MDYLARKKEYVFLNNKYATVRVHVKQINQTPYQLWSEGYSKNYRDTLTLLNEVLKYFNPNDLPPIIIISNQKLGAGSISSYFPKEDILFFNNYYHSQKRINDISSQKLFVSKTLTQIIKHELGHKKHWDAVKRFYKAHQSQYNNINEAKDALDGEIKSYISKQMEIDYTYLKKNISLYAYYCFEYAKKELKHNVINEVIAEVTAANGSKDPHLNKLITEELNYGK